MTAVSYVHVGVHAPALFGAGTLPNYGSNSPCTLGLGWFPSVASISWIDSEQNAIGIALEADTNDLISQVWPWVACWVGNQTVSLEVYDITAANPPLTALTWTTYVPGIDIFNGPQGWTSGAWGDFNGWNPSLGAVYSRYLALDSTVLTPRAWSLNTLQTIGNDATIFSFFGAGYDLIVGHVGAAGSMAGKWITRVRTHYWVQQLIDYDPFGPVTITPFIWVNSTRYFGDPISFSADQGVVELYFDWYVNPSNGLPWTPADIDQFDTAAAAPASGLGWHLDPTGSANNLGLILQAHLQVESAAVDPRLVMAAITPATMFPGMKGGTVCRQGWMQFTLRNTQTGAVGNLQLSRGHKYLFVFRLDTRTSSTSFGIATISTENPGDLTESLLTEGPPFWSQFTGPLGVGSSTRTGALGDGVTLDGANRRVLDIGIESGLTPAVSLVKSAGGVSADSQPYGTVSDLNGSDAWPDMGEWFNNSPVNTLLSMQQEFTAPVSDSYGWIRVLLATVAGTTDGNLTIQIKRRSDDVQMGGTATIAVTDLVSPTHRWQTVGVRTSGATFALVAGTQYYFDIRSTAAANQGWLVQCVNSGYEPQPYGPPAGTNAAAGWGGGVDKLTFSDPMMQQFGWATPGEPGSVVAAVNLSTVPSAPAGFAAVADVEVCSISHIWLTWTPVTTVECGAFLAYEIQRNDSLTGTWHRIALITTQTIGGFDDYESMCNTLAYYRIRLIRDDGTSSDWSATVSATVPMTGTPGLMFTSNESPLLTVFYQDLAESRAFEFPSNEQVFQPHNRNYQIVFRELEDRGVEFKSKLRVRAGRMPCGPGCDNATGFGPDVFDPLKAICRAGLSYVCVKNESGNRFFAYVKTPTAEWTQHGSERSGGFGAYTMDVEVTEVTDVPSSPDSSVTPAS